MKGDYRHKYYNIMQAYTWLPNIILYHKLSYFIHDPIIQLIGSDAKMPAILKYVICSSFYSTENGLICVLWLMCVPWDVDDDKSALVEVMAWCQLAPSHYLNQYC